MSPNLGNARRRTTAPGCSCAAAVAAMINKTPKLNNVLIWWPARSQWRDDGDCINAPAELSMRAGMLAPVRT